MRCLILSAVLLFSILFAVNCQAQDFVLEFIGEAQIKTGARFDDKTIGGLSGITYDATRNRYYAVSDDYSNIDPARFFTFTIDFIDGRLLNESIMPTGVTLLKDVDGIAFAKGAIDFEGIALYDDALFISSEGSPDTRHLPFIGKFELDGTHISELALPAKFIPTSNRTYGVARNKAFESLSVTSDRLFLFTANEEALSQDGEAANLKHRSPVRLLKYNLQEKVAVSEYLYWVEPLAQAPIPENGNTSCGLVDVIALDESHLISMERSYSEGVGTEVRLYSVSLAKAQNIAGVDRLDQIDPTKVNAARKTLLFDLTRLGITLDNIEGLTFGPILPDGRMSLILVSDNNFNQKQVTQFVAFATASTSKIYRDVTIPQIQGRSHMSPFQDCQVEGVRGIVTATALQRNSRGFWMQTPIPDDDVGTSEAIFVLLADSQEIPKVGEMLSVSGKVIEESREDELGRTVIVNARVLTVQTDLSLPEPQVVGIEGRMPPTEVIEDDNFVFFEPERDGIDFYESMESMLVTIDNPVVVGITNRFGECPVLASNGKLANLRTGRSGILLRENDYNPERIFLRSSNEYVVPESPVGSQFSGSVTGVLDYNFGQYRLILTQEPPTLLQSMLHREKTEIKKEQDRLTIASYNVENLDLSDPSTKFTLLAETIVKNLSAPDILALQEVQDDTGPEDDSTVTANKTLGRLISVIKESGGPSYRYCQMDPVNNADGGQPGGNSRVAFLYDPERVQLLERGNPRPITDSDLMPDGALAISPGRIGQEIDAFTDSRKPLVAEFSFNQKRMIIVNCHLNSKRGDAPVWGSTQPPVFVSEVRRSKQAGVIQSFVAAIVSKKPDANIIVLGDMNEHEFRKPMAKLAGDVLMNLTEFVPQPERYTYIWRGNSQTLDHIFVSKHLASENRFEVDIVHLNAEFEHSRRASDHDPVIASLKF